METSFGAPSAALERGERILLHIYFVTDVLDK